MKLTQIAEGIAKNRGRTDRIIQKYFQIAEEDDVSNTQWYAPNEGVLVTVRHADLELAIDTIEMHEGRTVLNLVDGGRSNFMSDDLELDVWKKIPNP